MVSEALGYRVRTDTLHSFSLPFFEYESVVMMMNMIMLMMVMTVLTN